MEPDTSIRKTICLPRDSSGTYLADEALTKRNWGCTNGSGGLTKAYQVARRYFKDGWVNRIVMMTDGDFNFGLQDGVSVGDFVAEQRKHDVMK